LTILSTLQDTKQHRQVFAIMVPMTLSGLSIPLLGMVDTAMMGHLDAAYYLGAVAVGSLVFSFLFWGFGFLRMGVTGLTAQAYGAQDQTKILGTLTRGLSLALCLGVLLILLQDAIVHFSLLLIESSDNVERNLALYLEVRIFSAPAALINYVLLGWFLGIHRPRLTLYLLILVNVSNIVLDLLFVMVWDWRVQGVAWASVCAEYMGLLLGIYLIRAYAKEKKLTWDWRQDLMWEKFTALFHVSGNIFIRTLCLISCFAFFTLQGAKFGETILAANAVLMNFQTFMAYGLDGFAHAAEALVGKHSGRRDRRALLDTIVICAFWSIVVALTFSACYYGLGPSLIGLLTGLTNVREAALEYLPWAIAAPILSVGGYLFDGIFIGAAWSAAMRNTMLISSVVFVLAWYFSQQWENHGLWFALMSFMLARGITMAFEFRRKQKML